jgi:hypothetical protein
MNSESNNDKAEIKENIFDLISPKDLDRLVNNLSEEDFNRLSRFVLKRNQVAFNGKIDPLPDFGNNEFKVFDERKEISKITDKVLEIRKRRYVAFVYYYSHIDQTDDQIIEFIKLCNPKLSYVQAAVDLNAIKNVIGNMPRVRKELIRYQVIELQKRAYQHAESLGNVDAMVAAANGIGKAANLDKDDPEIPWDEMLPPSFEPVNDLEALGEGFEKHQSVERDIERMRKKYGEIEDAKIA